MFCRRWFFTAVAFAAFLHIPQPARAQPSAVTADQVIANYLKAVGAENFPAIKTFILKGALFGNITNFSRGARLPSQSQTQEQGAFEFYFKTPNLRYGLSLTENNIAIDSYGCDGKVSWRIDSNLHRTEDKPKSEKPEFCRQGADPVVLPPSGPHVRLRLNGEKKVGDRMAWEIKVDDPNTPRPETYYFDAETYLLLRRGILGSDRSVTYSDYRDVGESRSPLRSSSDSRIPRSSWPCGESKLISRWRTHGLRCPLPSPMGTCRFRCAQSIRSRLGLPSNRRRLLLCRALPSFPTHIFQTSLRARSQSCSELSRS